VLVVINAVQETIYPYKEQKDAVWLKDLDQAVVMAQKENKLLFIDVWAQFCSICIAINNTLLKEEDVLRAFDKNYILLKIDGTVATSEPFATLKAWYNITGFPTYLIVDPVTKKVIKQWDSKLYGMPKERFIAKIMQHARPE
jgi:thiol:disulfide interchange protein